MRSDCQEIPEPFTKADADKAETMEARVTMSRVAAGCQVYWPAPFEVCGLIKDKYNEMGGPNSFLLFPKSNELTNPGNTGKRTEFLGGNIYWSTATGAHPVAHEFLTKWGEKGYEGGYLRYPTTDEIVLPDGTNRRQEYQGGSIYWAVGIGAHTIQGAIKDKWLALGAQGGTLGFPISDENVTTDGVGRYNTFQNGGIYWSPTTGAHAIVGLNFAIWGFNGFEGGHYGYPTSDTVLDQLHPGRITQQFQHGTIAVGATSDPYDGGRCENGNIAGCRPAGENTLQECRHYELDANDIIAVYATGEYLDCHSYRHIALEHFASSPDIYSITPEEDRDFLQCTAYAIVYGMDYNGIGRQTTNTIGTHGYVVLNQNKSISTAYTSGDGKDWGGCAMTNGG